MRALYQVLEFHGPAVASLTMSERFTLANMSAEVGAKSGIFPADAVTEAFVRPRAKYSYTLVSADAADVEVLRFRVVDDDGAGGLLGIKHELLTQLDPNIHRLKKLN